MLETYFPPSYLQSFMRTQQIPKLLPRGFLNDQEIDNLSGKASLALFNSYQSHINLYSMPKGFVMQLNKKELCHKEWC